MSKALELAKFGREAVPTGAVVGDSDTQSLSNKTFSTNPVISSGTANGVAYLNGSKVLTTGTALVFDGTNLGVGITPAQTLHVKTSTSATPITLGVLSNATGLPALSFNGAYASTTMAGIYGNGATASNLYYEVPSGQSHYFGIADVTKMTLDSNGNLGIGTSSPATKLNVAISAANETTSALRLTNLSAAGYGIGIEFADELSSGRVVARIATNTPGTSATGDLYFQTRTASALTEKMRLDSSGNLLLGGATASGKLTVDPGSTSGTRIDGLHLPKNLTAQANYVAWQQGVAGWRAGIAYNDSTYPLSFYYGASTPTAAAPGTELMRINTYGDLTITGSLRSFASPAFSLGGNQFTDIMYIGAGGYGSIISGILTVYSTYSGAVTQNSYFVNVIGHGGGTGISMLSQGNYSTPATTIVYDRSQVLGGGSRVISVYNATGTNIAMSYSFSPVGANNSAAYYSTLYNTGTAGAGTGVPSGDAVYFGQNYATVKAANIIFPSAQSASSDANTLDDYEENTWTPAISGFVLSVARSSVTKIGRLVTVSATISIASGSGSGPVAITNLPFPGYNSEFTGSIMLNNIAYSGDPVIYCYPPSQTFEIYLSSNNASWLQLQKTSLTTASSIIFSITYISP